MTEIAKVYSNVCNYAMRLCFRNSKRSSFNHAVSLIVSQVEGSMTTSPGNVIKIRNSCPKITVYFTYLEAEVT